MLTPLIDLYDKWDEAGRAALVDDATRAILLASLGLFVVGLLAAILERRIKVPAPLARRISVAVVIAAAVLALGSLGAYAASPRRPDRLAARTPGRSSRPARASLATSAAAASAGRSSNYRYDYWRVAWQNFTRHPLIGVGADNYELDYTERGHSQATPRYAHSIELRVLSHTGLVGTLLFAGAIGLALFVAVPYAVRGKGFAPAVAGACLMVFAYWVVHGSVDWLWEYPGLGGPAFGMLGMAVALSTRGRADADGNAPRWPSLAGGVATVLLLTASLTLPWLAERDLRHVLDTDAADPFDSLDRLDRAAKLNPLSPNFDKASGVILARQGRVDEAALRFREVLERSPRDSYAELQLGVIASELGQREEALAHLERASELAPRETGCKRRPSSRPTAAVHLTSTGSTDA